MSESLNLLKGLLTKNGNSQHDILCILSLFLNLVRKVPSFRGSIVKGNSIYNKFYCFINYFAPRVNLMQVAKKPKPIYIPFPPDKTNLLRRQFMSHFLKLSTSSYNWRAFPKRLAIFYKNSFKKTDILNKEIDFTDLATKQNRWRTESAYKAKCNSQKKQKNVVKKSKQFYL